MTEELVNVPNLPTPYYSQAKKAIAEARTTDDVKEVRNKAMTIRMYAQQAKDTQMEKDAIFIRLRAERRIGEMLREGKDDRASVGGNRWGIDIDPGDVLMQDSEPRNAVVASEVQRAQDLALKEFITDDVDH